MKDLEQVLADAREEAGILRKHGQDAIADALLRLCQDVADATEDFRTWLSEPDAMLRCGKPRGWLRSRFADWCHAKNARWSPRNARAREYRAIIIPQRTDVVALRADARRAARGEEGVA